VIARDIAAVIEDYAAELARHAARIPDAASRDERINLALRVEELTRQAERLRSV
jgi:hypothetical protein